MLYDNDQDKKTQTIRRPPPQKKREYYTHRIYLFQATFQDQQNNLA